MSATLRPFQVIQANRAHSVADLPWARWLVFGGLSLVLHWLILQWALEQLAFSTLSPHQTEAPVIAYLSMPSVPVLPSPLPRPARIEPPAPPIKQAKSAKPGSPSTEAKDIPPVAVTEAELPTAPAPVASNDALALPVEVAAAVPSPAPMPAPQEKTADLLPQYSVSPPPPVQLRYAVHATRKGSPISGSARIDWQHDGKQYQLRGETSFLIFTLLSFDSVGQFDEAGLAPSQYSEKRVGRSPTNTHFNRPKPDLPAHPSNGDTISFSASSANFPRHAGAQDRASILWQLAGIARAAPQQVSTGAQFSIFVAGVRDAEIWKIAVLGLETLQMDGQSYQAWHFQRVPRAGSYEQKLDIWLAPEQQWYPVRLVYTEVNGDILELSINRIGNAPTSSSPPNFRTAEP